MLHSRQQLDTVSLILCCGKTCVICRVLCMISSVWAIFQSLLCLLAIQLIMGRSMCMKRLERLHIQRRAQHFMSGMVVLYCQRSFPHAQFTAFLIAGIIFTGATHYLRLYVPLVQKLFVGSFQSILRGPEKSGDQVPGAVFFLLGNLISGALFPPTFCSLSIIAVSVGDPFAGICGMLFASPRLVGSKTLAGTIGCGIVSGICLVVAIGPDTLSEFAQLFVLLGTSTAFSELFSVIDDNLTMPILFRFTMWIFYSFVPGHWNIGPTLMRIYTT